MRTTSSAFVFLALCAAAVSPRRYQFDLVVGSCRFARKTGAGRERMVHRADGRRANMTAPAMQALVSVFAWIQMIAAVVLVLALVVTVH